MQKQLGIFTFIISLTTAFDALTQEVSYFTHGEWGAFYGYAFPDHDYKHRDKRQFFINTF